MQNSSYLTFQKSGQMSITSLAMLMVLAMKPKTFSYWLRSERLSILILYPYEFNSIDQQSTLEL